MRRALVLALVVGCGAPAPDEVRVELRSVRDGLPIEVAVSALPPGARASAGGFLVPADTLPAPLVLPGFCPTTLTSGTNTLAPLVSIAPILPVGPGALFDLEVLPGCPAAIAGEVTWRGAEVTTERRGFGAHGVAPAPTLEGDVWGIVPVSADEAGVLELVATWTAPGRGPSIEHALRVAARSRTSGVPSVGRGTSVLLRGGPFRVHERPEGATAEVEHAEADLERLVPDRSGRWILRDAADRELAIRVGEHASTPLDCGRSDCHAREAEAALGSPMTGALLAHLAEPCALPCHATGEPGLPDGGFAHVARELGWIAPTTPPADPLAALPRPLRRLAGVGCTACHGPAAIPEEPARWAILRSDVCAVCHDAPPRYGHVAAWRESPMSRSADAPGTSDAACAGCHTTPGFLARHALRAEAEPRAIDVGCAACHAPHSDARLEVALVRRIPIPASLGVLDERWERSSSSVCLSCHAPEGDEVRASSAAILFGRGAVDAEGAPITTALPHDEVLCLDCHGASPSSDLERGAAHAFAIDPRRCVGCHERAGVTPTEDTTLAARAAALATALGLGVDDHRSPRAEDDAALRDLRLVFHDRGAWAHAPAYARAALDAAEQRAHAVPTR